MKLKMKVLNCLKKATLVLGVFASVQAQGQLTHLNWRNVTTLNAQDPTLSENNLVMRPDSPQAMRIGVEAAPGEFGDLYGTWAALGYANILSDYNGTQFSVPAASNLFGLTTSHGTDRAFFGQRAGSSLDESDALIAWGNNDGVVSGNRADKLIFSFYEVDNSPNNGRDYQGFDMAAFTPSGQFGLGTINPTHQLHTTGSVRFQGLTNLQTPEVVGIDASGVLYKTKITGGGIVNSCVTTNFIPKTVSAAGDLNCSQIFDNGSSVGIGTTGSFGYTWTGGLAGPSAPPASGTLKLAINGVSRALAYFATSDRRFKEDIKPVDNALSIVAQLNPVRYKWTSEKIDQYEFNTLPQIGFIAQEVADVIPEAVIKDDNGYLSLNYIEIIPVLTKAIKEQQKAIDDLTQAIAKLKGTSDAPQKSKIYQNYPNPHVGRTTIKYEVNEKFIAGGIYILDLSGKMLKSQPISKEGAGEVMFDMTEMKSGVYLYSLILDGREIETKKMTMIEQ